MNLFNLKHAKRLSLLLVLALAMAIVAACGGTNENNTPTGQNQNAQNSAVSNDSAAGSNGAGSGAANNVDSTTLQTTYPLTITDASGVEITLEQQPQRIVSLAPSETETLYAIGAGDLVVGVDDYSNYPPEAADKPHVGGMDTNIEAAAGLNPDFVVAGVSLNGSAVDALRALGITVYASESKTLDETIAHIEQMGVILNKQAEAKAVTDKMRADKQLVVDAVQGAEPKRVYLEFSLGWSVGKGEFLDELVTLAGGINVAGDQEGWFEIDPEAIIKANPQVIIYPDFGDTSILDAINSRPGWSEIDAVKNGQIYAVENDPLVRVGPRLTDGLLEVAKAIHPELLQ